jgi:predicted Fe-Mo cluster-binding NifX family protein
MKKISFPTSDRKTIDGHFGHTREFVIYTVENNKIVKEEFVTPPPHEPGVLPKFLATQGVDVIITGGMGAMAVKLFNNSNIEVILGALGNLDVALTKYLNDELANTGSACDHNHGDHDHSHH